MFCFKTSKNDDFNVYTGLNIKKSFIKYFINYLIVLFFPLTFHTYV